MSSPSSTDIDGILSTCDHLLNSNFLHNLTIENKQNLVRSIIMLNTATTTKRQGNNASSNNTHTTLLDMTSNCEPALLKRTHQLRSAITKVEDHRSRHILVNAIMLSDFTTSEHQMHKLLQLYSTRAEELDFNPPLARKSI